MNKLYMYLDRDFSTGLLNFYFFEKEEQGGRKRYVWSSNDSQIHRGSLMNETERMIPFIKIDETLVDCSPIYEGLKESLARIGILKLEDQHLLAYNESQEHIKTLKDRVKFLENIIQNKNLVEQEIFYKKELSEYASQVFSFEQRQQQKITELEEKLQRYKTVFGDVL